MRPGTTCCHGPKNTATRKVVFDRVCGLQVIQSCLALVLVVALQAPPCVPAEFPRQDTRVGWHLSPQGIFPSQDGTLLS